ncbi:type VI secretion system baseplate subunit TssG [Mangrovitalea sediminis]|uniref:type VI secretion system baseplate subunit TssG n=1 Tax=Mangrovitalea sediminis TaxID=1982043 RepID=UPI000BE59755|nr:type VI secretion system baseplate subunit TssG [Mangrovitalea sediminis]
MSLPDYLETAQEEDVFQAIQMLEQHLLTRASRAGLPKNGVGSLQLPDRETLRFKATPGVSYPGANITAVDLPEEPGKPAEVFVSFMALTGFNGILPRHYSELISERLRHRDRALADFLDLFNHRLVSLFYRAWQKHRLPVRFRYDDSNTVHGMVQALSGQHAESFDPTLAYYCALIQRTPRNAGNLERILSDMLGCPVRLEQFVGRWLDIPGRDQTRASRHHQFNRLGDDLILGGRTWNTQSHICIHIEPRTREDADGLCPGGSRLPKLQNVIRHYLGEPISFSLRVSIESRNADTVALGRPSARIGRSSWLSAHSERTAQRSVHFRGDKKYPVYNQANAGYQRQGK